MKNYNIHIAKKVRFLGGKIELSAGSFYGAGPRHEKHLY
jgi:hypothetical protein